MNRTEIAPQWSGFPLSGYQAFLPRSEKLRETVESLAAQAVSAARRSKPKPDLPKAPRSRCWSSENGRARIQSLMRVPEIHPKDIAPLGLGTAIRRDHAATGAA